MIYTQQDFLEDIQKIGSNPDRTKQTALANMLAAKLKSIFQNNHKNIISFIQKYTDQSLALVHFTPEEIFQIAKVVCQDQPKTNNSVFLKTVFEPFTLNNTKINYEEHKAITFPNPETVWLKNILENNDCKSLSSKLPITCRHINGSQYLHDAIVWFIASLIADDAKDKDSSIQYYRGYCQHFYAHRVEIIANSLHKAYESQLQLNETIDTKLNGIFVKMSRAVHEIRGVIAGVKNKHIYHHYLHELISLLRQVNTRVKNKSSIITCDPTNLVQTFLSTIDHIASMISESAYCLHEKEIEGSTKVSCDETKIDLDDDFDELLHQSCATPDDTVIRVEEDLFDQGIATSYALFRESTSPETSGQFNFFFANSNPTVALPATDQFNPTSNTSKN